MKRIPLLLCLFLPNFVLLAQDFTQVTKLTASVPHASDWFGQDVSISGDYAVVGAPRANNLKGAAYVFKRSGSNWPQMQILTSADSATDEIYGDEVVVEGDLMIVGAPRDADFGTNTGSAYAYKLIGNTWTFFQKLLPFGDVSDFQIFGSAIAISGSKLVIGAYGNDHAGSAAGAAYTFIYNGTSWIPGQKLTASDAAANDQFGRVVDIHGNKIIIGAFYNTTGQTQGTAYVFEDDGNGFIETALLNAAGAASHVVFGFSAAISDDVAVIGSSTNSIAAFNTPAFIFKRNNDGSWYQSQMLTDASGENFAMCVSLNGNMAFASGSPGNPGLRKVQALNWDGLAWSSGQNIVANPAQLYDQFATNFEADGNYLIVGAHGDSMLAANAGAAYIFSNAVLGNDAENKPVIGVYPNPSSGSFEISFSQKYDAIHLELSDVNGRKLLSETFVSADKINFAINGSTGVYFARLFCGGNVSETIKIIKK